MIYRNRLHFAAIVRKARAEGTLTSYDKQGQWRHATVNWRWHIYEPAWQSMLHQPAWQSMLHHERERGDDDGVEYARSARCARGAAVMAHTPGPWEAQWPKYDCAIIGQNHHRVATVHFDTGKDAAEANARLIAAAPELLAALKAVINDVDCEQGADVHEDVVVAVRAAIAKAEGISK